MATPRLSESSLKLQPPDHCRRTMSKTCFTVVWSVLTWSVLTWSVLTWSVLTWSVLTWFVLTWSVLTWFVLTWFVLTWFVLTQSSCHLTWDNCLECQCTIVKLIQSTERHSMRIKKQCHKLNTGFNRTDPQVVLTALCEDSLWGYLVSLQTQL